MKRSNQVIINVKGKAPQLKPKWKYDAGKYGAVYVYDCVFYKSKGKLCVDLEVVEGHSGTGADVVGAVVTKIMHVEGRSRIGTVCGGCGAGRHKICCPSKIYDFGHGVDINIKCRNGSSQRVITIPFGEIRIV